MPNFSKKDRIRIFTSLFRGRTDVFARRWEKWDGSVSGYSPAYKDWAKKEHAPLSDYFIEKHLLGQMVLGLYPLLSDNTSYFIAVDFDGDKWIEDAKRLLKTCKKHGLAVCVEISRSGNGGHVWYFFEENYPAYKSRQIFFHLLRESRNIDDLDKEDSFDRLFPNQDYLSGKGLGNLIALPLQGQSRKEGNTTFLDPDNKFELIDDPWKFLYNAERITTEKLDGLFNKFTSNTGSQKIRKKSDGNLSLALAEYILILKSDATPSLTNFLRDELNFLNAEYIIKQRMGLATFKIEKYFKAVVKDENNILIPKGFLSKLLDHLKENSIGYTVEDRRTKLDRVNLKPTFELFNYQREALGYFDDTDSGVLVAPPGSGKTLMGLELIARKQQPALVLTHRKQIYGQWLDSIESFLGIPKKDIGQYVSTKKSVQSPITVAMVQTLARVGNWEPLKSAFGTLIVDECHHMPARMFRDVVTKFNPYYLYGLTATPKRRNNDEELIYAYLGNIVYEIPRDYKEKLSKKKQSSTLEIVIKDTSLSLPFLPKRTDYQSILKILTFDSGRNRLIAEDVASEARWNNRCLILTERKEHVDLLNFYLKKDFEVITLTGSMTPRKRKQQEKQIQEGNFQILIATGQLLGEGSDINNLDRLFLVFPFAFEGKLIQYIGRIQRGEEEIKKVYDYRDSNIDILEKLFKKRQRYYNKLKA